MYLAQRYNTATRVRIEPRPLAPETKALPLGHRVSLELLLASFLWLSEKISIWGMLLLAVGWVVEKRQYILKRKSFATLTKMLVPIFGPKQSLSDNAIDKYLYLPCIQHKNQNGVAYGWRAATIFLRQPPI